MPWLIFVVDSSSICYHYLANAGINQSEFPAFVTNGYIMLMSTPLLHTWLEASSHGTTQM